MKFLKTASQSEIDYVKLLIETFHVPVEEVKKKVPGVIA